MMYLGDFAEDATVRFGWNTNAVAGESITRGTNGTISVYKDGGTTQSTAGITDTEDFDSLTGVHLCTIDTSADAFYEAGSEYMVVLSAAGIDSKTVNAVLAHFSIERSGGALASIKAGVTASALGTQAKADVNAEVDTALSDYDPPTKAELDAAVSPLATAANLATVASYIDTEVAAIKAVTDKLPDSGALTSLATASALATVDANVDAILADTGTDGVVVASLGAQAKSDVNAEVVDALNTDTYAEPGQGAPAATASLVTKIGYLYKNWRNKKTQTSDTFSLYNDDGTTVGQKSTTSDDGTTATKGEMATGA